MTVSRPAGVPVAFRTLGCKVNRVESEDIAADLLGRGAVLVAEDEAAVVVVNTCTVTGEADAKARKAVRQALSAAGGPVVVVTGCLAAVDAQALEAIDERVVVEADKQRVADRVAELLDLGVGHGGVVEHPVRAGEGFRTRAMLKVEDGCDVFCAYCIVPYARGVPRSVGLGDAVAQARALVSAGVREIVLTGINLGRYRDPESGAALPALVSAIAHTGVARLRLSSIEPPDLTDELLAVLADTPAACAHLHVPLQSGSDAVLAAMRRTYTVAEYLARIDAARAALPGIAVTTDVIAGFPGETEDQAAETLAVVERVGFTKLHVFRYSARPGTPAAEMPQVDPRVRARRAEALRDLDAVLASRFSARRVGAITEVLVEQVRGEIAEGTTREYLKVRFEDRGAQPGDLVDVRIDSAQGLTATGTRV